MLMMLCLTTIRSNQQRVKSGCQNIIHISKAELMMGDHNHWVCECVCIFVYTSNNASHMVYSHMYHFTDVWIFLHFFYWHSNCLWLNVKIANLFRVARMFYLFHWLLVICGSFYEIYNRHYNHHVCVFVCIKKHKKWSLIWMLKSFKNKHEDYVL